MLNDKEISFIKELTKGYIDSYSNLNGDINLQEDEEFSEVILKEIELCKSLTEKLSIIENKNTKFFLKSNMNVLMCKVWEELEQNKDYYKLNIELYDRLILVKKDKEIYDFTVQMAELSEYETETFFKKGFQTAINLVKNNIEIGIGSNLKPMHKAI